MYVFIDLLVYFLKTVQLIFFSSNVCMFYKYTL